MQSRVRNYLSRAAGLLFYLLAGATLSWAQVEGYYYTEVTPKGHLFKMITGGLGSFVIIFMGFGGFATLFMMRQGRAGQSVPLAGIAMLLIAGTLFALRVMIRAGMFGHEYLEW